MDVPRFGWLQMTKSHQWDFVLFFSLLTAALVYVSILDQHANTPCLNCLAKLDFFNRKAKQHFVSNARSLMAEGQHFKGSPNKLFTDMGALIVILSQYVDDVQNDANLNL
jgi:hypothetical protein